MVVATFRNFYAHRNDHTAQKARNIARYYTILEGGAGLYAAVLPKKKTVRFHDYDEVYKIPGFYEGLFYESLQCCSPSRVAQLLDDVLEDFEDNPEELRVLDVGAGNGIVTMVASNSSPSSKSGISYSKRMASPPIHSSGQASLHPRALRRRS